MKGANLKKLGVVVPRSRPSTNWDGYIVESCVIWDDPNENKYGMVFTAYGLNTELGVLIGSTGLAWSEDLLTWTKDPASPILERNLTEEGSPDYGGITGPYIHYEDGTYYLFYIGISEPGYEAGEKTLNLVTSDSIHGPWERYEGNPIISPTGNGWRKNDIFHPNIVKVDGTYYMFFNANGNPSGDSIGYATSTDLYNWNVDDINSPLLTKGSSGQWDDASVGDPCVYMWNGTWYMAYIGVNQGAVSAGDGLAYTTIEDFPFGWVKYEGNPVLSPSPTLEVGNYDDVFAHKPFIWITEDETYYHFYTSVGPPYNDRTIQIALSVDKMPKLLGNTLIWE